jgi:nucleotide-binding universal stress UspA family protein
VYNKVVVPLDGSDLAEITLPHVAEIAGGCHIPQIFLVSVTEHVKGKTSVAWWGEAASAREFHMPPQSSGIALGSSHTGVLYSSDSSRLKDVPAELGRMARTALDYLSKKSAELSQRGLNAEVRVLIGNPAEEIVNFTEKEEADLIIMATTGKSGLNRWAMGNVANKVAKATVVPVLLVQPGPGFRETRGRRRGAAT